MDKFQTFIPIVKHYTNEEGEKWVFALKEFGDQEKFDNIEAYEPFYFDDISMDISKVPVIYTADGILYNKDLKTGKKIEFAQNEENKKKAFCPYAPLEGNNNAKENESSDQSEDETVEEETSKKKKDKTKSNTKPGSNDGKKKKIVKRKPKNTSSDKTSTDSDTKNEMPTKKIVKKTLKKKIKILKEIKS